MLTLEMREFHPTLGWSAALPAHLDGPQTLVLAFGPSEGLAVEALGALRAAFPSSHLAGCSTAGEILHRSISDDTLAVCVCRFGRTPLRTASSRVNGVADSFDAGARVARDLYAEDLRGVLVFCDGLSVNGSALVRGVNAVVGQGVVVTGGMAGDGSRFERTWVIERGEARAAVVGAVGLYGNRVRIGHGSRGGWDVFGPERLVTRSEGNVLYELDGSPALDLYKAYLGERASGLPATALLFPLSIREGVNDEKSLVRTVLSVSEPDRSLTFAGDIPEGGHARLMRANFDRLIEGASEAGRLASEIARCEGPTLALAISCVGRRLVLGERSEDEVEAAYDALPRRTQMVGFYAYGEISPYDTGTSDLHNQTMTLTRVGEA